MLTLSTFAVCAAAFVALAVNCEESSKISIMVSANPPVVKETILKKRQYYPSESSSSSSSSSWNSGADWMDASPPKTYYYKAPQKPAKPILQYMETSDDNNNYQSDYQSSSPYAAPKEQYAMPISQASLSTIKQQYVPVYATKPYYKQKKNYYQYVGGAAAAPAAPTVLVSGRQELLLDVNFFNDYDSIDARNNNSLWEWLGTDTGGYLADRASFIRQPRNYKQKAHVDIASVPFGQYIAPDDPNANFTDLTYYEGAIQLREALPLNAMQRLLVRLLFGCKTVNADQFPASSSYSLNAWDDPRLANCFIQLASPDNGVGFQCLATNEGVWAAYYRTPTATGNGTQTFFALRRIGNRRSQKDLIDCAIQYDARLNEATFFLNGYRVWTVSSVGAAPFGDGVTIVNVFGNGTALPVTPLTALTLALGTSSRLDLPDPNDPTSTKALVLIVDDADYYAPGLTFYDPLGLPQNKNYGQGAVLSAYRLKIIRAESLPTSVSSAPIQSPAVYMQPPYMGGGSILFERSGVKNATTSV